MTQRILQGSKILASLIKERRIELGLTIEEAASRAGVGSKTWYRYETGASIRKDKCKGICKALNWNRFPFQSDEDDLLLEYTNHEVWSPYLEKKYGIKAALSFAAGSDILLDQLNEDLEELSSLPSDTHIGQLNISMLKDCLPRQFLTHYNYEFIFQMNCSLTLFRKQAKNGIPIIAHSVLEELIIYLCCTKASFVLELNTALCNLENNTADSYIDWVFDLFEDMDIISFLYSDMYLTQDHPYHFSHWSEKQFFMN